MTHTITYKGRVIKGDESLYLVHTPYQGKRHKGESVWRIIDPPPPGDASYQRAKRRKALRRKRR